MLSILKRYPVSRLSLIVLAAAHLLLGFILWRTIQDSYPSGWDTLPQFYLFSKFLTLVGNGHLSGYDLQWLAGYPVFRFYPPLAYAFLALPHWLSFGFISPELSFSLGQFLLAHLFLFIAFETTRRIIGNEAAVVSLPFSLLFLLENDVGRIVGLNAIYSMGILPGFLGYIEVLLFLALVDSVRKKVTHSGIAYLALLFSLLLYTHILSAIFAFFLLLMSLVSSPKFRIRDCFAVGLIAAVLSFPVLYPFIFERGSTAAARIGSSLDPLMVLFKGFSADEVNSSFQSLRLLVADFHVSLDLLWQIVSAVLLLPWRALLSLICLLVGCFTLHRNGRDSLVWTFIVALILLPREVLPSILSSELHYYRFSPYVWLLAIPIMSQGLLRLSTACRNFLSSELRVSFSVALGILVFFALSNSLLKARNIQTDLSGFSLFKPSQEVVQYFKDHRPVGRVAIESPQDLDKLGGSPHLLTSLLPLCCQIPVVPGLLVESSRSASFFNPALVALGNHLQWGSLRLLEDPSFKLQNPESMVRRLALFGVDTLIVKSPRSIGYLSRVPQNLITIDRMIAPFVIYKIHIARPYIEETEFRPFLFVKRGDLTFREFSEEWFKVPEVFDRPVIYTKKSLKEIPEGERSQIGGLFLSTLKITQSILDEARYWRRRGIEVVIHQEALPPEDLLPPFDAASIGRLIPDVRTEAGKLQMRKVLTEKVVPVRRVVAPIHWEDEYIEFSSTGGTVLNRTYAPGFRLEAGTRTVYEVTPSLMFVFGEGESRISYRAFR